MESIWGGREIVTAKIFSSMSLTVSLHLAPILAQFGTIGNSVFSFWLVVFTDFSAMEEVKYFWAPARAKVKLNIMTPKWNGQKVHGIEMRSELVLELKIFKAGIVKIYNLVHSEYLGEHNWNKRPWTCWGIRICGYIITDGFRK